MGLLDAVGLAGGHVSAYQHGGALHLLSHEDPRLETPLSATTGRTRFMGATDVFGGPHEIRECLRHLEVIASASSSKQLT